MTAPDYPVLAWIAAIVLVCYLPRTVQRIRRGRATAVRRQLRADLMREAELQQVTGQRDEAQRLAESLESLNAALWRANDDLVGALEKRMTDEERGRLQRGLTIYDRLVTDVLDRSTWGGGES